MEQMKEQHRLLVYRLLYSGQIKFINYCKTQNRWSHKSSLS